MDVTAHHAREKRAASRSQRNAAKGNRSDHSGRNQSEAKHCHIGGGSIVANIAMPRNKRADGLFKSGDSQNIALLKASGRENSDGNAIAAGRKKKNSPPVKFFQDVITDGIREKDKVK